jgi:glycosyltransferase involved in cell wall biosynthesis
MFAVGLERGLVLRVAERVEGNMTALTVAVLTNFVAPYRVPLFRCLRRDFSALKILVSTRMESDRQWQCEWGDLEVHLQKCMTLAKRWRHPSGFREAGYVHIPYDTYSSLKRMRPGVVISGELGARSLLALLYRMSRAGRRTKLVLWATLSERTEQNRGVLREALRRLLLRAADGVIVNGASGTRYVSCLGVERKNVFRVPQTVDVEQFMHAPLERGPSGNLRLLYVGSLTERKGVKPFLTVLCRWSELHPEREIELWIAGDGPLKGWLVSLNTPRNLSLRLLGQVPYATLPDIYSQCGVFVLPSLADEWGLVVNEAMASGLPVLGSIYSQAVEELVEDGVSGWLIRPDQAKEVYQALEQVFHLPAEQLDQMRANARSRVEKLTPAWVAGQISQVIHHVCGSDPAGS